jgi:5'-nucleotidase
VVARVWWVRGLLAAVLVVVAACGGGDDGDGGDEQGRGSDGGSSTTAAAGDGETAEVLRVLVTNDDGIGGEGIDALVKGLEDLVDDVEVTVVAPAENQSGTGDSSTDPPPPAQEAALLSGHEAIAVEGFPADAVNHALDEVLDEPPHLVVSGVNEGQNLGPVVYASGTVGAARTAARRGVPALAVSQGLAEVLDYESGVYFATDWVNQHRDALLAGEVGTDTVANINVPSCMVGEIRGIVEVATATEGGERALDPADCTSAVTDPPDDIQGFLVGYAVLADVALDPPT